ncbi:MAG TPA: hypothetical protein VL051_07120 [Burkholderiaceae bacterium]|nr:hypothetical protein [Burkholderiaceae bacterium]
MEIGADGATSKRQAGRKADANSVGVPRASSKSVFPHYLIPGIKDRVRSANRCTHEFANAT